MYQDKKSIHRHIANGSVTDNHTFDIIGTTLTQHNTLMESFTEVSGAGIQIALDKFQGASLVVSFSLTYAGSTYPTTIAYVKTYTNSEPLTEINTLGANVCPVQFQSRYLDADNATLTAEGTCIIPRMELEEDEQQYVAIGFATGTISGRIGGQLTAYTKEYPFYQPSK